MGWITDEGKVLNIRNDCPKQVDLKYYRQKIIRELVQSPRYGMLYWEANNLPYIYLIEWFCFLCYNKTMEIGIAITTHNRYEIFKRTYDEFKKHLPKNSVFIVVDDSSEIPVPEADFRFEENVGVAASKNKCLELLDNAECTDFFLFDDDVYPVTDNWWWEYTQQKIPHLQWLHDYNGRAEPRRTWRRGIYTCSTNARGQMLFFKKICLEVVGGYDVRLGKFGAEHGNISHRIWRAGLIPQQNMDVPHKTGVPFILQEESLGYENSSVGLKYQELADAARERNKKNYYKTYFYPYK